jgi:hypothetical protein
MTARNDDGIGFKAGTTGDDFDGKISDPLPQ